MVAPFAGAWIEILRHCQSHSVYPVAPFAGAWIEIGSRKGLHFSVWSLPSRERGLKYNETYVFITDSMSLPSRERGLKSALKSSSFRAKCVAPFAGAWIEIPKSIVSPLISRSLPSRERGLKCFKAACDAGSECRSLRGSVD